eukprot:3397621-Prymnesium_polylepis.1
MGRSRFDSISAYSQNHFMTMVLVPFTLRYDHAIYVSEDVLVTNCYDALPPQDVSSEWGIYARADTATRPLLDHSSTSPPRDLEPPFRPETWNLTSRVAAQRRRFEPDLIQRRDGSTLA